MLVTATDLKQLVLRYALCVMRYAFCAFHLAFHYLRVNREAQHKRLIAAVSFSYLSLPSNSAKKLLFYFPIRGILKTS